MKTPHITGRGAAYGLALALGLAVAAMGYISSFTNLSAYANGHGWRWGPALPIGLDLGIPALLILDWLRASVFLRSAAWALAVSTVAANGAVAAGDWKDRALHAIMPALAILIVEAARHLRDDPTRMDRVRMSRWLLSPVRTIRLWRRMVLWEVTSYSEALARESAILHGRTALTAHYGKTRWRQTRKVVPVVLRHLLDTGQLPSSVLHSLDQSAAVRAWIETVLTDLAPPVPESAPEPEPVRVEIPRTGPDAIPDPVEVARARWELIWVRQDSIRPEGVTADRFASAIAIARQWFEQVGTQITNEELRVRLKIAKPMADVIAKVIRSAYQSGPVLADQIPDQAPMAGGGGSGESGPAETGDGPGEDRSGLNGEPVGPPSPNGKVLTQAGES